MKKMIGVILWSDAAEQKAVIWCEDQGELAFLDAGTNAEPPPVFFDVGDVVRFDIRSERNLRRAFNAEKMDQDWGASLPEKLINHHNGIDDDVTILPFPGTNRAHIVQPRERRTVSQ